MFVDASAIVAIIGDEPDRLSLSGRLAKAEQVFVSPVVVYEAIAGLARRRACLILDAEKLVNAFLDDVQAEMIDIGASIASEAVRAFSRYGRGKQPGSLLCGVKRHTARISHGPAKSIENQLARFVAQHALPGTARESCRRRNTWAFLIP